MFCKLCGEHLYKEITWDNLFRFNYVIHRECETKILKNQDFVAIPFLDKIILYTYIVEEKYEESDTEYLFMEYGNILFEQCLNDKKWSTVLFIDKRLTSETLFLVTNLADTHIVFLSVFNEGFL